ncbi:DUF418 domain-containing protein [Streptomyces sp. M10(2022)]
MMRSGRGRAWTAGVLCVASVAVWVGSALFTDPALRVWALDYFPDPHAPVRPGCGRRSGGETRVAASCPAALAVALVAAGHVALVPWSHAVPDSVWYSPYSASHLLSAPLFALLVAAAAAADVEGRRTYLTSPWMIRLGHWSFAWYLFHEIVIRALLGWLGRPVSQAGTAKMWLMALVISLTVAALAYHWVEHPLERLLRRAGPGGGGAGGRTKRARDSASRTGHVTSEPAPAGDKSVQGHSEARS